MLQESGIPLACVEPTLVYSEGRSDSLAKMVSLLKFAGIFSKKMRPMLVTDIPELLPQMLGGAFLDGLVGLLDHILGDGVMRLHLIPGTAVALAEALDGAHEAVELGMGLRRVGTLTRLRVHLVYECREGRRAPMPITCAHISTPHTMKPIALETKTAVAILKNPLDWGENSTGIRIVFLLAVGKGDQKGMEHLYDLLVRIIEEQSLQKELLEAHDFESLHAVLSNVL